MSGARDRDRVPMRPFLISVDEAGDYRLTIRETRFNSQNFPVVTVTKVDEAFRTSAAARAFAKAHYGAETGEFALPPRQR
jgi:hypothetical protein